MNSIDDTIEMTEQTQNFDVAAKALFPYRNAAEGLAAMKEQTAKNLLRLRTGLEIINSDIPPLMFLVDKIIAYGALTIVSSVPKIGKSWFMLQLALAVSDEKPFLGYETQKAACLYLALEDSDCQIKSRLETMQYGNGANINQNLYFAVECPKISSPKFAECINNTLAEHPEIKLIIVDALTTIRSEKTQGKSDWQHDYDEGHLLAEIAHKRNVAVVVIHHTRKMEAGYTLSRVAGTHALLASADNIIVLNENRNDNTKVMAHITGRSVETMDLWLQFDRESCLWSIDPEGKHELSNNELIKQRQNVICDAIVRLVDEADGPVNVNCRDILKACEQYSDDPHNIPPSVQSVGKALPKVHSWLSEKGICHMVHPNGTGGSKHVFFRKPEYIESTIDQNQKKE